jgi:uncharacterized membrane protein YidH (DUF202 family)
MFKNKSVQAKLITVSLLFFGFVFSTFGLNHVSLQPVSEISSPQELNLVINTDLPAAKAQTLKPLPIISANPLIATPEPEKKFVLEQNRIVSLLLVVLIGTLLLLFAFLSPVVGLFWRPNNQDSLRDKAWFLTESFPKLLEGVSVILIVMVIAVLTLAGVLESQGTISILSVLVGYVLGRKSTQIERSAVGSNRSESMTKLVTPTRNPSSQGLDDVWKG